MGHPAATSFRHPGNTRCTALRKRCSCGFLLSPHARRFLTTCLAAFSQSVRFVMVLPETLSCGWEGFLSHPCVFFFFFFFFLWFLASFSATPSEVKPHQHFQRGSDEHAGKKRQMSVQPGVDRIRERDENQQQRHNRKTEDPPPLFHSPATGFAGCDHIF